MNSNYYTFLVTPFSTTMSDYPDNESEAVLIYYLGCDNECEECHNIQFKDRSYKLGKELSVEIVWHILKKEYLSEYTNKIVLSGGDPLYHKNIEFTKNLLNKINNTIDVCVYTGKDIDYVKENNVKNFKYIKCGKYELNKFQQPEKTDYYIKFASYNQNLYDSEYELLSRSGIYYFKKE